MYDMFINPRPRAGTLGPSLPNGWSLVGILVDKWRAYLKLIKWTQRNVFVEILLKMMDSRARRERDIYSLCSPCQLQSEVAIVVN